jgi:hypothetical protein
MSDDECHKCGSEIPFAHGVNTEIDEQRVFLCSACWNSHILEGSGVDFEEMKIKPVTMKDCDGDEHTFHIQSLVFGDHIIVEAKELLENNDIGYKFCVTGGLEEGSPEDLLLAVYDKIKRNLARKHIVKSENQDDRIKDQTVVGRIEWDQDYHGEKPELWIDGRRFTLDELGKMMMTFEGWQFKLEIFDPSDDV